jgi:hypothetical protein
MNTLPLIPIGAKRNSRVAIVRPTLASLQTRLRCIKRAERNLRHVSSRKGLSQTQREQITKQTGELNKTRQSILTYVAGLKTSVREAMRNIIPENSLA